MTRKEILNKLANVEFVLFSLYAQDNVSQEEIDATHKTLQTVMESINKIEVIK